MGLFLFLCLLLACSGGDDDPGSKPAPSDTTDTGSTPSPAAIEALLAEWQAAGPNGVGYRTVDISYSDPVATAGAQRTLRTSLWYPTDASDGEEAFYQDIFPAEGVWVDAPLVPGPHPVALFSHGHQAYGEAAGFLMEHLASHGWVVVAPDHTGNLTWDGADRDTEIYVQRPLDVSAVLDWLDAPGGDPVAGHLGPERMALGHSFGGFTIHANGGATWSEAAIAACPDETAFCSTMTDPLAERLRQGFGDPRIQALVSMAPGDWRLFESGMATIDVPLMLMSGGLDGATPTNADLMWGALDGDSNVYLHFPDFGHNGFTDFAGTLDPPGAEEAEVGWRSVSAYVQAFAAQHLQGVDAGPVLDGTLPVGTAAVEVR